MRVVVAHPAQQHSYRMAAALKKSDMLSKYITTVYYAKHSLTGLTASLLRGNFKAKANARCCDALEDQDVIRFCEAEGLLKLLALNTPILKKQYYRIKYHTADRFAKKVAKYVIKHGADAVVAYDDTSPVLFEILKEKSPQTLRVLDTSAASILYMRRIYENDFELAPRFAARLRKERSICWSRDNIERAKREVKATQKFLVPSRFTAESLLYCGVRKEQLCYCPYGVDLSDFSLKDYDADIGKRPIRFIYVGGVKELKGIYYLLEAFKDIPQEKATLTVVGKYDEKDEDIQCYKDKAIFTGSLLHSEIPAVLKDADVFIFPSLGDSFSLAAMEAAACGLPLILSENTGVADCVKDGEEGFIVPIQSVSALKEKINYFISRPEQIERMGRKAAVMAQCYSWDAYDREVSKLFRSFEKNESDFAG